jgi:hypothetical protein
VTQEEHQEHHKALHRALDELVADWLASDRDSSIYRNSVLNLLLWSSKQTEGPFHDAWETETKAVKKSLCDSCSRPTCPLCGCPAREVLMTARVRCELNEDGSVGRTLWAGERLGMPLYVCGGDHRFCDVAVEHTGALQPSSLEV